MLRQVKEPNSSHALRRISPDPDALLRPEIQPAPPASPRMHHTTHRRCAAGPSTRNRAEESLSEVICCFSASGREFARHTCCTHPRKRADRRWTPSRGSTSSRRCRQSTACSASPPDIAWDSQGNFYISDGYINSRVAKFNKDGDWVKSWGEPGNGPGQFQTVHAIAVDQNDRRRRGTGACRRCCCIRRRNSAGRRSLITDLRSWLAGYVFGQPAIQSQRGNFKNPARLPAGPETDFSRSGRRCSRRRPFRAGCSSPCASAGSCRAAR
jgi:hypothetical protein